MSVSTALLEITKDLLVLAMLHRIYSPISHGSAKSQTRDVRLKKDVLLTT